MGKKVLLLALASVLMSLCVPMGAQQVFPKGATKEEVMRKIPGLVIDDEGNATMNGEPVSFISLGYSVKPQQSEPSKPHSDTLILGPGFNDEDTTLKRLTADMILQVKAYEYPRILNDYEYLLEIKPISDEVKNDPDEDRILAVPQGITIKDLLNQLPGVKTDKEGRLITKSRKDIVTSIEFNGVKVYPENISQVYPDDYKLLSGAIHVVIMDRKHFREYLSKTDRDDLPKRRAEITISYYPRLNANALLNNILRERHIIENSNQTHYEK